MHARLADRADDDDAQAPACARHVAIFGVAELSWAGGDPGLVLLAGCGEGYLLVHWTCVSEFPL